jgi:hypothetical protein
MYRQLGSNHQQLKGYTYMNNIYKSLNNYLCNSDSIVHPRLTALFINSVLPCSFPPIQMII